MYMMQFGIKVKDELDYNTIIQKQLADSIKISYNTIQSWITKARLPDAEEAKKIARALNTSAEFLVSGENSRNTNSEIRHTITKIKQTFNKIVDEYLK